MKRLYAIGEALIDMTPQETGKGISEVKGFEPHVGGAPANVLGAFRVLGGEASLITQVGDDPFGDKIVNLLEEYHIDTSYVLRTKEANTALAFVALKDDGDREFNFYRKPSADMLYDAKNVQDDWFSDAFALHFCSVDLGDFPMGEAHRRAIQVAREKDVLISFDPNLRFNLWENPEDLKSAVLEFMPMTNLVKISDEELEFITGNADPDQAIPALLDTYPNMQLVVYTEGKNGQRAYTRTAKARDTYTASHAVDTTGAGDGFIGSFLYQIASRGLGAKDLEKLTANDLESMLHFSGCFAGKSVTRPGAIQSYPSMEEMLAEKGW